MPARLARADMLRVAHNIGKKGDPLPAEMANDPDYKAEHARGAGYHQRAAGFHPPARPRNKPATPAPSSPATPATRPATTRTGSSKPGYLDRAFSPTAAANRVGAGSIAGAGDAGGLLLMLLLYPMFLSIVKYGAVGPSLWFQAKWLNKTLSDAEVGEASKRGSLQPTKNAPNSGVAVPNYVDPDGYRYPTGWAGKLRVTPDGKTEKNPHYDPKLPQVT